MTKCEVCERLPAEYEDTERLYGQAILALDSVRGTATADEYMKARKVTGEARLDSEVARLELEKHRRVHSKAN